MILFITQFDNPAGHWLAESDFCQTLQDDWWLFQGLLICPKDYLRLMPQILILKSLIFFNEQRETLLSCHVALPGYFQTCPKSQKRLWPVQKSFIPQESAWCLHGGSSYAYKCQGLQNLFSVSSMIIFRCCFIPF